MASLWNMRHRLDVARACVWNSLVPLYRVQYCYNWGSATKLRSVLLRWRWFHHADVSNTAARVSSGRGQQFILPGWFNLTSISNVTADVVLSPYIDQLRRLYHTNVCNAATDTDSKVHGANMGPAWVLSAPDGPHVGPMNFAIWAR